jgi:hypothetical protein
MSRLRTAALALLLLPGAAAAQGAAERGAFVTRLGSDTLAVERYTRAGNTFESDIAARVPLTRRMHYTGTLNPDGTFSELRVTATPISEGPGQLPPLDATIVFGEDSTRSTLTIGDSTQKAAVAAPAGTMPVTTFSFALYELIAKRALKTGGDSLSLHVVGLGANQTVETYAVRRGADAMDIGYFGSPLHIRMDKKGNVLRVDGRETTNKVIVDRVASVDVDRAQRDFAAKDHAGQAVGQLSARDTLAATVGTAHLTVDYARPHRRGRDIFGSVVPWGQVWRTGANAATGFTTDADLTINGTRIAKGSYTLWTLPTPEGATLIVNSQTGQWGTQYDESKDFARIKLAREQLAQPVEIFTIAVEPAERGGVLSLVWDRTKYMAPILVN